MKDKKNLNTSVILLALFFFAFSINSYAQTVSAEKTDAVAAYVRDKEEDAGLVRKRVAPVVITKISSRVKLSAEMVFDLEKMTFAMINAKRAEIGLEPLAWSDEVAKIARLHSENMVNLKFFSHRGQDGKMVNDRADMLGVTKWTALGENIAYNRGFKDPIATAVEKWMLSEGHRENLLNKRWKESAIGIAVTEDGTYYFTQVFMVKK